MSEVAVAPRQDAGERYGVMRARGFRAMGVKAGIRRDKYDVALIVSDRACTAAGVFTQNAFAAAPVAVSREHLAGGDVRAVVVNSGNANAATGAQGLEDAREMAALAARHLGLTPAQVLVSSTGMIGVALPMDRLRAGIASCSAALDEGDGSQAAEAICTTDSHKKTAHRSLSVAGHEFTVAGMAKGSGMIHPNMATMLAFVTTDAMVPAPALQAATRDAVDKTFNMITVDGDESTNDMVVVLANGAVGGPRLEPGSEGWDAFQDALTAVCRDLARMIAADGEGATRLMEVEVCGAASIPDARRAARAVARSNLVKSALHGGDPNWGRIVAAVGASGARLDPARVRVSVAPGGASARSAPVTLFAGTPTNGDSRSAAQSILTGAAVRIIIDLGAGTEIAEAWGCDLTEEYVRFNSAYTT